MALDCVMRASSAPEPKEDPPMLSSEKFRDFSAGAAGSSLALDQNGIGAGCYLSYVAGLARCVSAGLTFGLGGWLSSGANRRERTLKI
jgi:hypothetical protein